MPVASTALKILSLHCGQGQSMLTHLSTSAFLLLEVNLGLLRLSELACLALLFGAGNLKSIFGPDDNKLVIIVTITSFSYEITVID